MRNSVTLLLVSGLMVITASAVAAPMLSVTHVLIRFYEQSGSSIAPVFNNVQMINTSSGSECIGIPTSINTAAYANHSKTFAVTCANTGSQSSTFNLNLIFNPVLGKSNFAQQIYTVNVVNGEIKTTGVTNKYSGNDTCQYFTSTAMPSDLNSKNSTNGTPTLPIQVNVGCLGL